MNRPWFWNLLLLLALVVAVTRLFSSLGAPPPRLPVLQEVSREPGTYASPLPPPPSEGYGEIVARNLFNQARGKVEAVKAAPVAAPPPKPPDPPKATLFGVVTDEEGDTYAYMSEVSKGSAVKPRKYRAGDTFSGARIKEIRPDRVIFTVGSSEHTVALRTPKEGVAPSPSPPVASPQRALPSRTPRRQQALGNGSAPLEPDLGRRRSVRETPRRPARSSSRRRPSRLPAGDEWREDFPEDTDEFYDDEGYPLEEDVYYEEGDDFQEEEW